MVDACAIRAQATPLTIARYGYYYGDRADDPAAAAGIAALRASVRGRRVLGAGASAAPARAARGCALCDAARRSPRPDFLGDDGIILGSVGRRCLMLAGQQGVALAAPPRAGKGTGVVVPNALNWPGSLVCVDIKRENWTITAGFRRALGPGVLSL